MQKGTIETRLKPKDAMETRFKQKGMRETCFKHRGMRGKLALCKRVCNFYAFIQSVQDFSDTAQLAWACKGGGGHIENLQPVHACEFSATMCTECFL